MIKICEFIDISLNDLFSIDDSSTLSDDEVKFIGALMDNLEALNILKEY